MTTTKRGYRGKVGAMTQPTITTTKCPTCGDDLRTVSMTSVQPAPYPPFTTSFTHPCERCAPESVNA